MNDQTVRPPGKTTVAPEVLIQIASLAALSVEGVSRLAMVPGDVGRLFRREMYDGVKISIENNTVYADLFVVLQRDIDVHQTCRAIQNRVARSFSEMVGMEVGRVNVHVEDIDYDNPEEH
jgi:uncharacterized alkaline shock family protein YloU